MFQEDSQLFDYYSPGSHASKMVAEFGCPSFQAFINNIQEGQGGGGGAAVDHG